MGKLPLILKLVKIDAVGHCQAGQASGSVPYDMLPIVSASRRMKKHIRTAPKGVSQGLRVDAMMSLGSSIVKGSD
jgi:hypothetical protein